MSKIGAGMAALTLFGAGVAEASVPEQVFLPDQEAKAQKQLSEPFVYAKKKEVQQQVVRPKLQQKIQPVSVASSQKMIEYNGQLIPEDQAAQAIEQMRNTPQQPVVKRSLVKEQQKRQVRQEVQREIQPEMPRLVNYEGQLIPEDQAAQVIAQKNGSFTVTPQIVAQAQLLPVYQVPQRVKLEESVSSTSSTEDYGASTKRFAEANGKEIGVLGIRGNRYVQQNAILEATKLRPGMTLRESDVRKDLSSISETGWFKDVTSMFSVKDGKAVLLYKVKENPVLKDVEPEGITLVDTNVLRKMFPVGQLFNFKEAQKTITKLLEEYKEKGYVAATVGRSEITDDGVFHLGIYEGVIENINVKGSKRTKDFVVLREMRQKPGDVINTKLLQRSVQRLYGTGIFEDVDVKMSPGKKPGQYDLEVDVTENRNATVNLGASYSKSNGLMYNINLRDRNFLGRGDTAGIGFEFDGKDHNKNYELEYIKPWLDKKETTAAFHLYDRTHSDTDYDRSGNEIGNYDRKRAGQEITFSRATSEYTRTYLSVKHTKDSYKGPTEGGLQYYESSFDKYLTDPSSPYYKYNGKWPATAEGRRKEDFGDVWSVGISHVYDSRDNPYDAHSGKRMEYSIEQGFGDFTYTKFDADFRYYYPFGKSVLAWDTEIGYAVGKMPLSRRFSIGGINNLRGYQDNQFRGNSLLRTSLEYRVPLAKIVTGVFFADAGYAWDKRDEKQFNLSDIKFGYGVGLRLKTPMGPVRLDYSLGKERRFYFSFGASF